MANQSMAIKHQHRKWHHVLLSWSTVWVLVVCLLNPVLPEVIYRVDPLALLAATLRTYQRAGCDSEQLSLSCPRGTSISIELAQYGRAGDLSDHSLCPPVSQEDFTTTGSAGDSVIHSGTEIEVKPPESCTVSGLQYALLQTVVDACQKKRHCKFAASPKTNSVGGDPCSGIRKFVEIAYKCRPYEFRSKVACENDNMPLVCNPYSRIAIYSASFGHTERENVQCGHGNTSNKPEDNSKQTCLVSYATETVMQICHGRRRCSITADAGTFGRPCKNDVRMYLKVVYTCIPRKVLKDRYETAPESDEPQQSELDMDQDELYDEDQFYKESEAIPPAPKLQGAIPNPVFPYDFGLAVDSPTSTIMPPLLSRNDSSLEVQLMSATKIWFHNSGHSTDFSTDVTTSTVDTLNVNEAGLWKNFVHRRKCQLEDDWGPIEINCTDEDIISERVEVIGFLVNWMQTYAYIRKNQEQFYLYLIISVATGVLLCLTLVIGRLTLQRRRARRKNSSSSGSISGKHSEAVGIVEGVGTGVGGGKYQHSATGETQIPNSFSDDISDIDADIDLTTPMPVPSLSSRNETYMTYAPTPNCTYGGLQPPHSSSSISSASTMLLPTTHHGGLLVSGHTNPMGGNQRATPPPATLYTSMGVCSPSVSGAMTIGSHILAPSALSSISHHTAGTPSYLTGSMMVPGHHHPHAGTLRRTMIPTSMGMMSTPSPPPVSGSMGPHSMVGIPSATSIYYDTTIPRNFNRVRPSMGLNLLPMSGTIGSAASPASSTCTGTSGSRAGTPTGGTLVNGTIPEIPSITVTTSPGPASLALVNQQHSLKISKHQMLQELDKSSREADVNQSSSQHQQQDQSSAQPVQCNVQMCATGRTYCF